jgi:uncharacterized membrane protein
MAEEQKPDATAPTTPPSPAPPDPCAVWSHGTWGQRGLQIHLREEELGWGVVANLVGVLPVVAPWVVLRVMRSSRYVRFYALQSLFIGIALLVLWFYLWMLDAVPSEEIPAIYWLRHHVIVAGVVTGAVYIVLGFLAIKAYRGVLYRLPVVGWHAYNAACDFMPERPRRRRGKAGAAPQPTAEEEADRESGAGPPPAAPGPASTPLTPKQ